VQLEKQKIDQRSNLYTRKNAPEKTKSVCGRLGNS